MRKYKVMMMFRILGVWEWRQHGTVEVDDRQYPHVRAQMKFPELRHMNLWKLV